ncbi:DUF883 family protein [Neisseria sp. ZJ106]|uniref:DUF883 family protein n=1 Tax=Neisseria lisongii TaxID=2912188 RepID=A0ABY7RH48_9NEIS|nr:DUF883 family protein [Neisseria lisongii]MCF7521626.1 DUF883 family protein [Neisseria lisongii]WCL70862.1 DUF883 family protein [Neisseria lisongii]
MSKHDYDARKQALLDDIREVMNDVESLYQNGVEAGSDEAKAAKAKLQEKLDAAKEKLIRFEEEAAERVKHHAEQARDKYETFKDEAGKRFDEGKRRFAEFEEEARQSVRDRAAQADDAIRDKPYYAMGIAALAGLVVGALLNRR